MSRQGISKSAVGLSSRFTRKAFVKMAFELAVILVLLLFMMSIAEGREFCQGDDYWCDVGHCCGNGECCTYYYELWWFWLVWFLIVFVIGFCVWQRKRFRPWREQDQFRNRCGLCGPPDLYPDILPIPPVKLPTYAEIGETASFSTPPPPYTCECYMPTVSLAGLGSFDQPPPEVGAPPSYMQYAHIIAPLMPRLQPSASTGTQFPEGVQSSIVTTCTDSTNTLQEGEALLESPSPVQTPDSESQCLSCSLSHSTVGRSCSCASVRSGPSVSETRHPGHIVPAGPPSQGYLRPVWLSHSAIGKVEPPNNRSNSNFGSRLLVPSRGAYFNPCPRCVSRSVSSLRHCASSSAIMRDASTSTLPQLIPSSPTPAPSPSCRNEEPERFVRRNSNSLPRNFVCSTKINNSR